MICGAPPHSTKAGAWLREAIADANADEQAALEEYFALDRDFTSDNTEEHVSPETSGQASEDEQEPRQVPRYEKLGLDIAESPDETSLRDGLEFSLHSETWPPLPEKFLQFTFLSSETESSDSPRGRHMVGRRNSPRTQNAARKAWSYAGKGQKTSSGRQNSSWNGRVQTPKGSTDGSPESTKQRISDPGSRMGVGVNGDNTGGAQAPPTPNRPPSEKAQTSPSTSSAGAVGLRAGPQPSGTSHELTQELQSSVNAAQVRPNAQGDVRHLDQLGQEASAPRAQVPEAPQEVAGNGAGHPPEPPTGAGAAAADETGNLPPQAGASASGHGGQTQPVGPYGDASPTTSSGSNPRRQPRKTQKSTRYSEQDPRIHGPKSNRRHITPRGSTSRENTEDWTGERQLPVHLHAELQQFFEEPAANGAPTAGPTIPEGRSVGPGVLPAAGQLPQQANFLNSTYGELSSDPSTFQWPGANAQVLANQSFPAGPPNQHYIAAVPQGVPAFAGFPSSQSSIAPVQSRGWFTTPATSASTLQDLDVSLSTDQSAQGFQPHGQYQNVAQGGVATGQYAQLYTGQQAVFLSHAAAGPPPVATQGQPQLPGQGFTPHRGETGTTANIYVRNGQDVTSSSTSTGPENVPLPSDASQMGSDQQDSSIANPAVCHPNTLNGGEVQAQERAENAGTLSTSPAAEHNGSPAAGQRSAKAAGEPAPNVGPPAGDDLVDRKRQRTDRSVATEDGPFQHAAFTITACWPSNGRHDAVPRICFSEHHQQCQFTANRASEPDFPRGVELALTTSRDPLGRTASSVESHDDRRRSPQESENASSRTGELLRVSASPPSTGTSASRAVAPREDYNQEQGDETREVAIADVRTTRNDDAGTPEIRAFFQEPREMARLEFRSGPHGEVILLDGNMTRDVQRTGATSWHEYAIQVTEYDTAHLHPEKVAWQRVLKEHQRSMRTCQCTRMLDIYDAVKAGTPERGFPQRIIKQLAAKGLTTETARDAVNLAHSFRDRREFLMHAREIVRYCQRHADTCSEIKDGKPYNARWHDRADDLRYDEIYVICALEFHDPEIRQIRARVCCFMRQLDILRTERTSYKHTFKSVRGDLETTATDHYHHVMELVRELQGQALRREAQARARQLQEEFRSTAAAVRFITSIVLEVIYRTARTVVQHRFANKRGDAETANGNVYCHRRRQPETTWSGRHSQEESDADDYRMAIFCTYFVPVISFFLRLTAAALAGAIIAIVCRTMRTATRHHYANKRGDGETAHGNVYCHLASGYTGPPSRFPGGRRPGRHDAHYNRYAASEPPMDRNQHPPSSEDQDDYEDRYNQALRNQERRSSRRRRSSHSPSDNSRSPDRSQEWEAQTVHTNFNDVTSFVDTWVMPRRRTRSHHHRQQKAQGNAETSRIMSELVRKDKVRQDYEDAVKTEPPKLNVHLDWASAYRTIQQRNGGFDPDIMPQPSQYTAVMQDSQAVVRDINQGDKNSKPPTKKEIEQRLRHIDIFYSWLPEDAKEEKQYVENCYLIAFTYKKYLSAEKATRSMHFALPTFGTRDKPNLQAFYQSGIRTKLLSELLDTWDMVANTSAAEHLTFEAFKDLLRIALRGPFVTPMKTILQESTTPEILVAKMATYYSPSIEQDARQRLGTFQREQHETVQSAFLRAKELVLKVSHKFPAQSRDHMVTENCLDLLKMMTAHTNPKIKDKLETRIRNIQDNGRPVELDKLVDYVATLEHEYRHVQTTSTDHPLVIRHFARINDDEAEISIRKEEKVSDSGKTHSSRKHNAEARRSSSPYQSPRRTLTASRPSSRAQTPTGEAQTLKQKTEAAMAATTTTKPSTESQSFRQPINDVTMTEQSSPRKRPRSETSDATTNGYQPRPPTPRPQYTQTRPRSPSPAVGTRAYSPGGRSYEYQHNNKSGKNQWFEIPQASLPSNRPYICWNEHGQGGHAIIPQKNYRLVPNPAGTTHVQGREFVQVEQAAPFQHAGAAAPGTVAPATTPATSQKADDSCHTWLVEQLLEIIKSRDAGQDKAQKAQKGPTSAPRPRRDKKKEEIQLAAQFAETLAAVTAQEDAEEEAEEEEIALNPFQ